MQTDHSNAERHYPLNDLAAFAAGVSLSPSPGLVRLTFDITPDEAYDITYRCDHADQAGWAGWLDQLALWAQHGTPININNWRNQQVGIIPQQLRREPGA